ncbi:MAG TPA: hypothetical protein VNB52_09040 [Ilumatobacteraceae bacterium]|nr:hypothetical protein [Ilumatobacteraceae bacterium]
MAAVVFAALVAGCTVEAPGVSVVTTTTRLVRYDESAETLEVLDDQLHVERTIPVTHAGLTMPSSVDGSAVVDVRIDGTTVYDLRTGETFDLPIDDAGLELMSGTPVDSPWKLIDRPDGGRVFAVNVETGDYRDVGKQDGLDDSLQLFRFGTGLYVANQTDHSLAITIAGDRLEHHLVDGFLVAKRGSLEVTGETSATGDTSEWSLALLRDGQQIGDRLALAINNMIRVKLIDDTSAVIVADGAISVHNFATGADREIANFPEAFDVWITSPERIWIARDEQPTLLIDCEGKTVAEFAAGMYPIAARGGCSLITRWNVQETLLVDNNSGQTITTFVLDPEVFHGADVCTTWSFGLNAALVIDGRAVDLGFAGYVVDLSANGQQAIVGGNDGPVLFDTVSRKQTPLPDGEYRFAEL